MKIIVGGGISGLWLAAELKARSIPCCVLEKNALGQGQTLASQGMIHGGTKYALDGALSNAAKVIGEMPERWRQALAGMGSVNLQGVALERDSQLMWSVESVTANLLGFFASKIMQSRMERIDPASEPAFASPAYKGHLYRLNEPVLKLHTLVERFESLLEMQLLRAEVTRLIKKNGQVTGVETNQGQLEGEVILTAGEGAAALIRDAEFTSPIMQLRPLAMGLCRLNTPIPKIFGHQLGHSSKPKVTVSTHEINDKQYLYLGGQLAEDGVLCTDLVQIKKIEKTVGEAIPWLKPDIESTQVFRINRAEPYTEKGNRPDAAFVQPMAGAFVCWPTKLSLAPALADKLLDALKPETKACFPAWPRASAGEYPWA
ncbi:FAD-dependent oxidoreductase [Litorivicinus sp.]|jgi:glycine/D-amino acid oxidase-like deaminating enzyme|nr:FAD-dependent oxidoreductase [Litorivicinus sp.]MDC1239570.1 FAD-dependent oxidoreductase [Litorivicinus sp.]|tara:strand:- start:19125 stop:20243 length:1119 start_codon:yes stop_codon:yes gene_type:complete